MTEQEWLNCNDPTPMMEFVRSKAGDRKLRLFARACIPDYIRFMAYPKTDTGHLEAGAARPWLPGSRFATREGAMP